MNEVALFLELLNPDTLASIIADLYWNDGFDLAVKEACAAEVVNALIQRVGFDKAAAALAYAHVGVTEVLAFAGVTP